MEIIHLSGSDDVSRAGHAMQSAATEMKRAASEMSFAFEQHQRFLDDWLSRFQQAIEEKKP